MNTNNSILTRVFTQNMLKDLMYDYSDTPILSNIVKRYEINYDGETKNERIISEIYQYIQQYYGNVYYVNNKHIVGLMGNHLCYNACYISCENKEDKRQTCSFGCPCPICLNDIDGP